MAEGPFLLAAVERVAAELFPTRRLEADRIGGLVRARA
jgi:hypothetical protein